LVVTIEDAVRQAVAAEGGRDINPKDAPGFSPTSPGWAGLIAAGQIDAAGYSPTCASQPAPNINLFQTVSGFALGVGSTIVSTSASAAASAAASGTTSAGLLSGAAIPIVGGVIAAASVVVSIVNAILAHHKAAARQEQQLGCAAIAAFNNSYALIEQAVQNQQMTPEAAIAGLDQLYSQVSAFLAPSDSHSPYCSAVCELLIGMDVMIIYQKGRYAAMASPVMANPVPLFNPPGVVSVAPAATVTPISSQPAGAPAAFAIGGSSLVWILLLLVLVFLL
jgi:hypothetical protein